MTDVYSTPEEAARGDIPARFVRVVGVVIRGDSAVVAQLTNDGPPYEVETAYCERQGAGWTPSVSGNSTEGFLQTGKGVGTVLVWDEAPPGAVAARFEHRQVQKIVPVEDGCALAVFDDVPEEDSMLGVVRLAGWIDSQGVEQEIPHHEIPEWMREQVLERFRLRARQGIWPIDQPDESGEE